MVFPSAFGLKKKGALITLNTENTVVYQAYQEREQEDFLFFGVTSISTLLFAAKKSWLLNYDKNWVSDNGN